MIMSIFWEMEYEYIDICLNDAMRSKRVSKDKVKGRRVFHKKVSNLQLSILKLWWLWKNRKWKNCRHKDKSLEKYLDRCRRRR